jgi:hypothetical protein
VEQARAKARARDDELDLLDLRSSDFEGLEGGITGAVGVGTSSRQDSRVGDKEVEFEALASPASLASLALQLRPKRARKVPARYRG